MTGARGVRHALVRGVPATYDRCTTSQASEEPVDLSLARRQHRSYCEALRARGLELIWVDPDDRYPDCCFVEDPAIVAGDTAIISRMGVSSRVGEETAIADALRPFKKIQEIVIPGTLEGGDVLQIDNKLFVGLSKRTNRSGVEQVTALVSKFGFEVIPVEVMRGLHLKSSCTYIGEGTVVLVPGFVDERVFSEYNRIEVAPKEAPAADCLRIGSLVLILRGYPTSKRLIETAGFETRALEMSEFEKCEGALTCLSIVF
ncbi:MAG: arginine deiminase family protein [candidate division NC10 bacterium]